MSPRILFALTLISALPLAAQPTLPTPVPKVALPVQEKLDLTTPSAAVRSFAAALNRYDFAQMTQCVADVKPDDKGQYGPMVDQFKKMGIQILISEPRLRVHGNLASAALYSQLKMQAGPNNPPAEQPAQPENVLLRLIEGQWKIVGNAKMIGGQPAPETVPGMEPGEGFLTMLASFLVNPNIVSQRMNEGHLALCSNNLKQLALAAMQMLQEFDKTFAFAKAAEKATLDEKLKALLDQNWQKALYPYAKTPVIFFCPLRVELLGAETPETAARRARHDKLMADFGMAKAGEPYALNENLVGLKQLDIAKPSQTVLLYEGRDAKLDFRHDGKANVAFCDGHVVAVGPEEAKKLIWNPKEKNP